MLITMKRQVALSPAIEVRTREPVISWMAIYTHALVGALYLMAWLHGSTFATIPLLAGWAAGLIFQLKARRTHGTIVAATPIVAFVAWALVARIAPGALGL